MPETVLRETFGHRLKRVRLTTVEPLTGYPMTQKDLARRLNVTTMAIIYWESDKRWPSGTVRMVISSIWPEEFSQSGDVI